MARPRKNPDDPKWAKVSEHDGMTLGEYIKSIEGDRLDEGIVLVRVTFPGHVQHFAGTYSGIEVTDGPRGCVWSDGTTD